MSFVLRRKSPVVYGEKESLKSSWKPFERLPETGGRVSVSLYGQPVAGGAMALSTFNPMNNYL